MMATLFAQEFRITRRRLATAVGVAMFVALVSFGIALLRIPVLGGVVFGLGVMAVAAVAPLVLALLAESYWRTMYGREGYFTMTLPVRGRALFSAKVLYGFAAALVALALTLVGMAAAIVVFAVQQGGTMAAAIDGLRQMFAPFSPVTVWFAVACLALQFGFLVIAGAAIMSVGAEARFNHLGFGAPVVGGVILYFVMQFVGLAAMLFVPFGLTVAGPDAGSFVARGMLDDFVAALADGAEAQEANVIGLGIVFVTLAAAALLAWWGARSVERHTSLR